MFQILARMLIPNWKFFDSIGPVPILEWTQDPDFKPQARWLPLLERIPEGRCATKITRLFINADGNDRLYVHSQIENLVREMNTVENQTVDTTEWLKNKNFKALIERIEIDSRFQPAKAYRFRLRLAEDPEYELLFLSDLMKAEER